LRPPAYLRNDGKKDLESGGCVRLRTHGVPISFSDEVLATAVRLLRQQEEAEEARVREGICQGLEDMRAGRTQPLAEAFAEIRRDLNLPHGSMRGDSVARPTPHPIQNDRASDPCAD
jgi:hypothetical protein